jgi:hypothetical protein
MDCNDSIGHEHCPVLWDELIIVGGKSICSQSQGFAKRMRTRRHQEDPNHLIGN